MIIILKTREDNLVLINMDNLIVVEDYRQRIAVTFKNSGAGDADCILKFYDIPFQSFIDECKLQGLYKGGRS